MAGIVNGIDTTALEKGIDGFRQAPELARFEYRARNRWLGDTRNMTTIGSFFGAGGEQSSPARPFMLRTDEHQLLLGQDTGPNPVEHLLNSLAACVTTAIVLHAAARGIHLEEVESELKGHIDVRGPLGISDEVRKGYQDIEFTFRVRGEGSEQQLRELAEFSPVFDVVRNGTRVNLVVEKMKPRQTDETPPEQPAPM